MFTELLQIEIWRKKLEAAGYKVVPEAVDLESVASRDDAAEALRERRSRPTPAPMAP